MALLNWSRKKTPTDVDTLFINQLFDSLSDVVLLIDHQQQILKVNRCWEQITGERVADSLQRPLTDFLHPEDTPIWKNLFKSLTPQSREMVWFRLISRSGEIHWCEMRVQPLTPGSLFPLSATLCDITPQVRDEQLRNASHRSLQSLVNRLPAMLYRSRNNISWTMEYVSQGCAALTGYSAESLLNQSQISLGSMINPDDADYVWEEVQSALQIQAPFDLCYRLTRADGREIQVRDTGHGIYSDSGMVLGVEGIILQAQ